MTRLIVKDPSSSSHEYVNGQIVSVTINASPLIEAFLLSESVTIKPDPADPRFSRTAPEHFRLLDPINRTATLYLWVRSITDEINDEPITASIYVLPLFPTAELSLTGIISSNAILYRDRAKINIKTSIGVKEYLFSETDIIDEDMFSNNIPDVFIFSEEKSLHTLYVWLRDENNKINQHPFVVSIFTPLDNIVGHRPGLIFVDERQQGLTSESKNIRAINGLGDYIQWNNINFDPIGKNFCCLRLDRNAKGYLIQVSSQNDSNYLANSSFWESVEINVENIFRCDLSIRQNENIIFTHNEIIYEKTIRNIIINERISVVPYEISCETQIFDLTSDQNNKITLQIDDYDFEFLNRLLKQRPKVEGNFGSFTDTQMNEVHPFSEPISIEIDMNRNPTMSSCCQENEFPGEEITYLPEFCQAEITFTKKELDRLQDFGFTLNYSVTNSTNTVAINDTKLIIRNQNVSTSDNTPVQEFEVINPPNTFAEFTIQIDTNPEFSSPVTLAFRINETDSHILTLEGPNYQQISFHDQSVILGLGTFYWRVRRNQSDFTEPAMITIRTAPVLRLKFSVDSEFIKEVGSTAIVKVQAFDHLANPIEGAKIDFSIGHYSNTDVLGTAQTSVIMPNTRQTFPITAISESVAITHEMEAIDSSHLESEITFDKIEDPPPVVRYIIFRKLLAEVRSEDDDRILMVSQTPSSPIIRRDSIDQQEGVVFDPEQNHLIMARDLLPPKMADCKKAPVLVSEDDCKLRISWDEASDRGTTWHYDGKSVSNQNKLSEDFSITMHNGHKFDVLTAWMANNKTVSPSPYQTQGRIFPAYKIERIDPNLQKPSVIISETANQTTVVDNIETMSPDPVINFESTIENQSIKLKWTNPSILQINLENIIYRVRAFDIAGNNSFSDIQPAPEIDQCLQGILVTRINSTECVEESRLCQTFEQDLPLKHGSILPNSVIVKKLPECIIMHSGSEYSISSIGDENTGERATIVFHKTGIADENDRVIICYRYGRSIECGNLPAPSDFIIMPYDGTNGFQPNAQIDILDQIKISGSAYTYGAWVVAKNGELSQPEFTQILLN